MSNDKHEMPMSDTDIPAAVAKLKAWRHPNTSTKTVQVWRVEFAKRHHVTGQWLPEQATWPTEQYIREMAAELASDPNAACIHVTGPHDQEVPAMPAPFLVCQSCRHLIGCIQKRQCRAEQIQAPDPRGKAHSNPLSDHQDSRGRG